MILNIIYVRTYIYVWKKNVSINEPFVNGRIVTSKGGKVQSLKKRPVNKMGHVPMVWDKTTH